MCLWCGDKSKAYLETKAVQQHMVDKGHCKLLHEGDAFLEYAEFFDYRYLGFILMYTIHRYTVSTKNEAREFLV